VGQDREASEGPPIGMVGLRSLRDLGPPHILGLPYILKPGWKALESLTYVDSTRLATRSEETTLPGGARFAVR